MGDTGRHDLSTRNFTSCIPIVITLRNAGIYANKSLPLTQSFPKRPLPSLFSRPSHGRSMADDFGKVTTQYLATSSPFVKN